MVSTSTEPTEVGPSEWRFPEASTLEPGEDFVTIGADLTPATLVEAYRLGFFPMPADRRSIGWWHPDPRGVLPLDTFEPSRSLRRSCRRYSVTTNQAFDEVLRACADPRRHGCWIDRRIEQAYTELHRLGWAHSVEVWLGDDLVGGLYGLSIGGLFAGESMFHHATDASKVALVGLVERLRGAGNASDRLLDVQWRTEHLASLGVIEVPRGEYVERLADAVELPRPDLTTDGAPSVSTDGRFEPADGAPHV